jgi:hypothetical protein
VPGAVPVIAAPAADASVAPTVDGTITETSAIAFLSPLAGATVVREEIDGERWVARVAVSLEVQQVVSVELRVAEEEGSAALMSAPWEATLTLYGDGDRTLIARGLDLMGAEVARAELTIRVAAPTNTSCHAMLDALGIDWEPAGATRGVADPVRVQPDIRGVHYRYVSHERGRAMLMECTLAPRLAALSDMVQEYGIDEIAHIGIYNYRCIGGGDPDDGDCTPSQHAYARAIDIHEFGLAGSDETYNVETDWIITGGPICPGTPSSTADRVLHEIACRMFSEDIFHIILTPNYNAGHRNHYHVDLTPGADYIGSGVAGIDPLLPNLGH